MVQRYVRGITLVETLIYLALFTIVVGGLVASAYALFESSDRNQTKAMLQMEQDFLIAKIDWALDGAESISVPIDSRLSVTMWDASIRNPVQICLSSTAMRLSLQGVSCETLGDVLNNTNVHISNLIFIHTKSAGIDASERVEAGFTISATTPNGMTISQIASTTRYIHS